MIRNGARVKIHYRLRVDGKLLDSSAGREPFTYIQGAGQIVSGLETHLASLNAGDVTQVSVPPEQAYGPLNEEAVQTLPKDAFENPEGLRVGKLIQGTTLDGQSFSATVQEISGSEVILDLNHPLAGRTLDFEVEILEITDSRAPGKGRGKH